MKQNILFTYTEEYLPTPRCRNIKTREITASVCVDIEECSKEDTTLVMVVKKDGAYASATSIQDFAGAKITAQLNTFHYAVIDQIQGVNRQTALQDFAALIQSLNSGALDGYVCEKPGAVSACASNDSFTYVEFAANSGFTCDPAESSISVGLRKNSSLTEKINQILAGISAAQREEMMDAAIARQPAED